MALTTKISNCRIDNLVDTALIGEHQPGPILIQKPAKQQFVRVNPDTDYQFCAAVLHLEETGEHYLVTPSMMPFLEGEYRVTRLLLAIYRGAATPFLWPLKLSLDGRENSWNDSALRASEAAKSAWVRVASDANAKMYKVIRASGFAEEPLWPNDSMDDLVSRAFEGKIIDSTEHPVVQRLQGRM